MRIFIAFDVPETVSEKLKEIQKEIEGGRFSKPQRFHQTLKFIGEVDEKKAEEIKEKLRELRFGNLGVKLKGIGVFPHEDHIRVVWAGLEPKDRLAELKNKIEEALEGMGLKKDKKIFHPHITLARVKRLDDKEGFKKLLHRLRIPEEDFKIDKVRLYKSELKPEGPEHICLEEYMAE